MWHDGASPIGPRDAVSDVGEKTMQDAPPVDIMRWDAAVQAVSDWLIAQALGRVQLDFLFG